MSPIFENALDSLKVGMQFYMSGNQYSTRKHAILTVFHSIELMLKEYLYQVNPILIYRNIDKKITDNSATVGFSEILIRLENLNLGIPEEQAKAIRNLQSKRNRIEHHRYDHEDEDRELISQALKFILYFMEFQLQKLPEGLIEPELLENIRELVTDYNERHGVANHRLETWLKEKWPEWNIEEENTPEEFIGTDTCPQCRHEYLVMEQKDEPYCFWCCRGIPAEYCEICGQTKIEGVPCCEDYEPHLRIVT
ncbi:hypothetical protein NO559_02415 [Dasania sp. GY-MA-18]|uniref:Uncharacterized protein n=1 Tax=Dasania phycosphaerae TaxID=2950436 RepID=A0A9J6RHV1_9GAMM|nr:MULTISPECIES: hypothetical protein [Dasania]MCR8921607.1 hypothetical protein [Dasania sp. GY-MA-18]MCZ0864035.1 hypothetical protein [Dasania phycosphaerae]MCZ0867763.1 hypothetical protein [Dasania phycosphaerae]